MSRQTPLVYLAPAVQEQARTIVGGCPENRIQNAIAAGDVRFVDGNGLATITGDGWEATAVRGPGVTRPAPRCWRVTAVRPQPTTSEGGEQ